MRVFTAAGASTDTPIGRVLQVVGDRFRQRHHGELHRAVGAAAAVPADLEARDRGRVDDVAFAAVRADQRQEGLQPVDHAVKIDADVPLPLLRRQLGDRAAVDRDAGIVAGDMQRAERLDGGLAGRAAPRRGPKRRSRPRSPCAPSPRTSASAASSRSPRMSHSTTDMPARAKLRAMPSPMPDAAPVTIAVLPSSCCIDPPALGTSAHVAAQSVRPSWTVVAFVVYGSVNGNEAMRLRNGACERRCSGSGARRISGRASCSWLIGVAGIYVRPGPRVRLRGAHGAGLFPDRC